jgi:hypothetical protein
MLVAHASVVPALKMAWEAAVDAPELTPDRLDALVTAYRRLGPAAAETVTDRRLGDALWASALMARVAFAAPEAGMALHDDLP